MWNSIDIFRLVHEVKNLQATLAHLKQRLQDEQEQLQKLVTTRANLEHEIRTKANSIFIDQEKCMSMRKDSVEKVVKSIVQKCVSKI